MSCHRCGIDLNVTLFMKFTPLIYTYRTKIELKLNGLCFSFTALTIHQSCLQQLQTHQYCIREQPSVFTRSCLALIVRVCACMHVFQKKILHDWI